MLSQDYAALATADDVSSTISFPREEKGGTSSNHFFQHEQLCRREDDDIAK